jgi:hypothetical protein
MDILNVPDFDARLRQAKRRAQWELGSPEWATIIVSAFCNPDGDAERLQREQSDG